MSLDNQLRKSIILVTLKNELATLEKFKTPYGLSMFELGGLNIVVSFETTANICVVFDDAMDLGDSINDIIVTHKDIDDGTYLDGADLDDEMVIALLEKAELSDHKNNLL